MSDLSQIPTEQLLAMLQKSPEKYDPTEGMSTLDKMLAGTGKAFTDVGRGVGQLVGLTSQQDIDEAKKRDSALMNTGAGQVGNVVGNVAAALPAMLVPGANTVLGSTAIGGVMGMAQPVATGESRGANTALGAVAGGAGQALGAAAGRFLRPVQSSLDPQTAALAQAAQARGIPLDAADLTGSRPLTIMRDVMSNLPLTADRQAAIQSGKQAAFNRAVSGTFGASDDALTPQALQASRNRIGQQFTDLSARNELDPNNGLIGALAQIRKQASTDMTPDVAGVVNRKIDDILARFKAGAPEQIVPSPVLSESGQPFTSVVPATQASPMPGTAYRALDSELGRTVRTSSNGDIRYALGEVRTALRNAMDSSINDADRATWKEARKQYANLMTVAPIAAKSETGDVSGRTLLAAALRQNKSGAFNGAGELGELGRIGRAFIMEQTPNSGTAQRTFYQRMLENPLSAAWGQGVGGISLPVQAAMNSKAGQKYLANGAVALTAKQQKAINDLSRALALGVAANAE